jgi:hypothetical protein
MDAASDAAIEALCLSMEACMADNVSSRCF